ncbi:MAG: YraN family protein [Treponema sp.]|jgi:putative endonuclease|nr:YraN family protein [Treponema sp.]
MNSAGLGRKGEEQAAAALEAAGMEIIAKNIRSRQGEVDIVAIDKDTIVFVEVKAWSVYGLEDLQYGLNADKRRRIIETAKYFLSVNRKYNRMAVRFDVILIQENSFYHLASAFTESV